jgi:hypothetical protein
MKETEVALPTDGISSGSERISATDPNIKEIHKFHLS